VAKQLAQFAICNVSGHVSSNSSHENRNFVSKAIEFDIGEISADSANRPLVEPVQKIHPVELVQWNRRLENKRILCCGRRPRHEFVLGTSRQVRAFLEASDRFLK
jgi:hypothetical protein